MMKIENADKCSFAGTDADSDSTVQDLQVSQTIAKPNVVRSFSNYDSSTKPFEIICKEYRYDKYSRKLKCEPVWRHYKYYKTLEGAKDAIKAFRNSWYDKVYRDYPSMGDIENEAKYTYIKPTITIKRYMVIERDFDKPYR